MLSIGLKLEDWSGFSIEVGLPMSLIQAAFPQLGTTPADQQLRNVSSKAVVNDGHLFKIL